MTTHIVGIDHTLIGVHDLEGARSTYERLGFTITPRGRHIGWGTANYCIMFPRDYLELIGIVNAEEFTNNLDKFLKDRQGLMGVALQSDDAEETKASLSDRGIDADGPRDLARLLELPDGDVKPAFKLVFPEERATPGLKAFIVQHLTPELMRRPEWLDHANGATGIASMTVLVEDPLELEEPYANLFGSSHVIETDNTIVVRTGGGMFIFCHPDDVGMLHPEAREIEDVPLPYPVAMTLTVENIGATVRYFEQTGIPHRVMADGTAAVRAEHAEGVLLEFREAR